MRNFLKSALIIGTLVTPVVSFADAPAKSDKAAPAKDGGKDAKAEAPKTDVKGKTDAPKTDAKGKTDAPKTEQKNAPKSDKPTSTK